MANASNNSGSPIEALRSLVTNNFAPIPKWGFEVSVAFPTLQPNTTGDTIFLIPEAQIFPALEFTSPSIGTETQQFSYTGLKKPFPLRKQYSNFSVTLPMMNDFGAFNAFLSWRDSAYIDFNGASFTREYNRSLTGTVSVYMFDRKSNSSARGDSVYKLTFKEAFPTEILPIGFSQYETNSIQTFTINFAFRDYTREYETDYGT